MKRLCRYIGRMLLWLLSFLPLPVGHFLSGVISYVMSRSGSVTREARANLMMAFPDRTADEIDAICRKNIRSLFDYLFELLRFSRFPESKVRRHCTFHNVELLQEAFRDHQFVMCYAGHMLNYEILTSFSLLLKDYGMCQFYSPDPGNILQGYMQSMRSRFGTECISSLSPLRPICRHRDELGSGTSPLKGYIVGTLADVDSFNEGSACTLDFLGHRHRFTTGSERIARQFGMAVLYAEILSPRRGYYEVTLHRMEDCTADAPESSTAHDYPYTTAFAHLLEENIRKQPEIWLRWSIPYV